VDNLRIRLLLMEEHIRQLQSVGFNRISLGVQDFDPIVQFAINRIQSFERTKEVVDWARKYKYNSINIDLIYGLPHQTVKSVQFSVEKITSLMPDRIAFYSYAHVPWKSKGQRRYTEADLPAAEQKWEMYNTGKELLEAAGFTNINVNNTISFPGNANHEMGTARMGKDPKTSVLNAFNQMHEVKNVFITDGSCTTSSGCVNPSLTYMALTARACDYAVKEMKRMEI